MHEDERLLAKRMTTLLPLFYGRFLHPEWFLSHAGYEGKEDVDITLKLFCSIAKDDGWFLEPIGRSSNTPSHKRCFVVKRIGMTTYDEQARLAEAFENKSYDYEWCLVGNIVQSHYFAGEDRVVSGARLFAPGTKVYCLSGLWGMGYERIPVVGPRKGDGKLICTIVDARLVENFRCKKVFSKKVLELMGAHDYGRSWKHWVFRTGPKPSWKVVRKTIGEVAARLNRESEMRKTKCAI